MRPEEPPPPPKCSQFLFQLHLLLISPLGLSRPPPPSLSSWCFLFLIYFYNWLMVSHTETCFIYVSEHESMFKLCSGKSTYTHHQRGQLQEAICFFGKFLSEDLGELGSGCTSDVWMLMLQELKYSSLYFRSQGLAQERSESYIIYQICLPTEIPFSTGHDPLLSPTYILLIPILSVFLCLWSFDFD